MRPVLSLLLALVLSALTAITVHAETPRYDPEALLEQHEAALLKLQSQEEALAYFDKHFIKNYQDARQILNFINGLTDGTYQAAATAIIEGKVHSYRIDEALKSFKTVDLHLHSVTRGQPLTVRINEVANGLGYALTAVSVAGHMADWFQGDDTAMKKAGVAAWKGVFDWGFNALERLGMRGVSVAMGGVLIIDYALTTFMEEAHAQYEEFWWTAYSNYLNRNYRQLATGNAPWVKLSPEDMDRRLLEFWNAPIENAVNFHKNPGPHQRDGLAAADFQKPFAARYYRDFLHEPLKNYFRRQALNAEEEAWIKAAEYAEALHAQLQELKALREVLELAKAELQKGKAFKRLSATLSTSASGGVSGTVAPGDKVWLHYTYQVGRALGGASLRLVLTAKNGKKTELALPGQDFSGAQPGKADRGKADVTKAFAGLAPGPYRVKLVVQPDGEDGSPFEAATFVSVAEPATSAAQATPPPQAQPQPKPQPSVQSTPQPTQQSSPQPQAQTQGQAQVPTQSSHTFTDQECVRYIWQGNYEWLDKCLASGWNVNAVGSFDQGSGMYDGLHAGIGAPDPVKMLRHLIANGGNPNQAAHHSSMKRFTSVGQEILWDIMDWADREAPYPTWAADAIRLMSSEGVVPTPCIVNEALDTNCQTSVRPCPPRFSYDDLVTLLMHGIAGNDKNCSLEIESLLHMASEHPDERVLRLLEQTTGMNYKAESGDQQKPQGQQGQQASPACQQAMAEFQAADQRMRTGFEEYKSVTKQFLDRVGAGLSRTLQEGKTLDAEHEALTAEANHLMAKGSLTQAEADAYAAREDAYNARVNAFRQRMGRFEEFNRVWGAISERDCGYAIVSIKDHPIAREFGYPEADSTRLCKQHGQDKLAYDAAVFKLKSNGCTQP